MAMNSPFKCAVFFYDPIDGLCDIGSLGESNVILRGMNEEGAIVGSSRISGNATHAFLWTRRDGMKDIHSAVAPQTVSTQAFAISYDGWILVQATDHKRNNQIIGYHPEKGIGHSCSFGEWISFAMPVGQSNRFVYRSVRPSWHIVRIRIRPTVHHNWILDFGCEPVLVAPKVMADQSWSIYGMTDQGLIVGSLNKTINKGITQAGVEPFILRPIQTPDPDGK
jgi:probable HAF family extracellular repeat protein